MRTFAGLALGDQLARPWGKWILALAPRRVKVKESAYNQAVWNWEGYENGAGYGDRTRDIQLGKLAFYR